MPCLPSSTLVDKKVQVSIACTGKERNKNIFRTKTFSEQKQSGMF